MEGIGSAMKEMTERLDTLTATLDENKTEGNIDKKVVAGLNKNVEKLKRFEIRMLQTFRLETSSLHR